VYEIAKEVGIESKALVTRLQAMGYDVRSHASALDELDAKEAIDKIKAEQKANVVQQRISGRVIRRRARDTEGAAGDVPASEVVQEGAPAEQPAARETEEAQGEAGAGAQQPIAAEAPGSAQAAVEVAPAQASAPEAAHPVLPAAHAPAPVRPQAPAVRADDSTLYRAQVIRRPPPPSQYQAQVISRPAPDAARPSGIRVLKVVPGKEGRGHDFIDMSAPEKGRKKPTATRSVRADLREQLFDPFSQDFVPGSARRRRAVRSRVGHKTAITTPGAQKRVIRLEACQVSVSELAKRMGVKQIEVSRKLAEMGEEPAEPTEDKVLDLATAVLLAQQFDHEVQDASFKEEAILAACKEEAAGAGSERVHRPPVVTVMGHVDHGKTSILDAIRKTNVAAGEEGGITQHIGAYEVRLPKGSVTFIDTPGHEAFSAMRARGASVTDIVVLVVAAGDGIMPQTIEAIHHAQEAKVPIVVAINKIDLPDAQPDRIRQALTEYQLVAEEWGGDTMILEVSAKTKAGLDKLLESLLLQAEVMDLKADPQTPAIGTIIEARLDRGRGPVATLLVKDGTLHKGDFIIVGTTYGRVRMLFDPDGKMVDQVGPGRPVLVQGLDEVPGAGLAFNVVNNEREARKIVDHREEQEQASKSGQTARLTLEDFYEKLQGAEKPDLKILVKADVQGSAEAIRGALEKLSTPKVGIKVIHHGIGAITETDVNLASASGAMLIGFNVRPDTNAKKVAQTLNVDIRLYKIIYDLTEDIRKAQVGLLPVTTKENVIGRAEVRDLFTVPKVGTVAGVAVVDGKMVRGAMVRLLRDNIEVHQGKMSSLKRFKEDVREVAQGMECGIGLENYNDIKRGDVIEAYVLEEERPSL
jgi:translation initiation factor IF-2